MLDRIEGRILAASLEVLAALDGGAEGDSLDDGLTYIGHFLFVEVATLTRAVDAAENAAKRVAEKMASVRLCDKCQRHRIGGRCVTCTLDEDLAWIKRQSEGVAANTNVEA